MTDRQRILVVEDDAIIARDIQQTLQRLGYEASRIARTGDEACRAVEASTPDLVLMDIKLRGGSDGVEAAVRIRERWDVPVVYLTSHSDEATLQRAKATGPLGYLLKPFHERDLRTTIEVALHTHELQVRLARSERLASVGTLAAGMAHEINNPLAVVMGVAWSLRHALHRADEVLADVPGAEGARAELREAAQGLQALDEAAGRIRRVVQDMRRFVQPDRAERQVLDLPEVLDAAARMAAPHLRQSARLHRRYGATPSVQANEGQLVQVFTNLLVNAAQAIGEGDASAHRVELSTLTDDQGRAVVEVRDTGPGISKHDLPRVFDPFFTTKPVGAGTGLGLAVCHGIVTSLGGEITVQSEAGRGATFRVALPPAPPRAAPAGASASPDAGAASRGRVLVVDDEAQLCEVVRLMLAPRHDVVAETDPRAALARIAAGEDHDVILCDVMMPDMNGVDFYEALRETRPRSAGRVVFMSGGVLSQRAREFIDGAGVEVVQKPFTAQELEALVAARVAAIGGAR